MTFGDSNAMKVVGYRDAKFTDKIGEYSPLVNPETYSISQNIHVNSRAAQGNYVPTTTYNKGDQQILSFKILFDGTGAIKNVGNILPGLAVLGAPTTSVIDDISQFKTVVYNYDSSSHQQPFVQIRWGILIFKGRITSLSFNHKLFKPDGTPLRTEADCSFIGVIDEQTLALLQNPQSPDLTHTRTVKAGDTLSLLCYREYGDCKYYYQV